MCIISPCINIEVKIVHSFSPAKNSAGTKAYSMCICPVGSIICHTNTAMFAINIITEKFIA